MRDDVGKNWALRVSGWPYQTDARDVNVLRELPGRDVRPPRLWDCCQLTVQTVRSDAVVTQPYRSRRVRNIAKSDL
jgi:hypothetical protein